MNNNLLLLFAGLILVLWLFSNKKQREGFDTIFYQHSIQPDDTLKELTEDNYIDVPKYHPNQRTDGEFPDQTVRTKPVIVSSKYHPGQYNSYELESVVAFPLKQDHKVRPYGKLIDEGDFPRGEWRPFNDFNQRLSYTELASSSDINSSFDNSYFQLYGMEQEHGLKRTQKEIAELKRLGVDTYPYKNVNECFSRCSRDKSCYGVDVANKKCTLIRQPPFDYERYSYNDSVNNQPYEIYQQFNHVRKPHGTIFYYYGTEDGNDAYGGALSPKQCLSECPKCQLGKCPKDYRCTNVRTDPKNGIECVITNKNSYDEKSDRMYDDPTIKAIPSSDRINTDAKYQLQNEGGVTFTQPTVSDARNRSIQAA
jgi:hypothetical protein